MAYTQELRVALDAARAAGEVQSAFRGKMLSVEIKTDASPVTEVDKQCESIIRDMVHRHFPNDGFLGEETGADKGTSGRTWIVDPLDGTRPFIRDLPTHSVLIALENGNAMAVGCIHLPALGETYWASKAGGAFLNNRPVRVSQTSRLQEVFGSAFGYVEKSDSADGGRLMRLMKSWGYTYGFMDAYTYGSIAAGRIDACVNLLDKPWDCAAAVCIVEEAGGRFSDVSGQQSVYNGSCVLTNGFVHDAVLEYFSPSRLHD